MTYSFDDQHNRGKAAERQLDGYFAAEYEITAASAGEQRQGIDRIYRKRSDGETLRVEYKTDWTAGRTGNAFLETVSVDSVGKPGWIHTSQADRLYYFVPDAGTVYIIRFDRLRRYYSFWLSVCRKAPPIPNEGYRTHGLLVPLDYLAGCAEQVVQVDGGVHSSD